jgi:hypothetical protein
MADNETKFRRRDKSQVAPADRNVVLCASRDDLYRFLVADDGYVLSQRIPMRRREIAMDDRTVRMALARHWRASDAGDFEAEHEIYRDDAVLDYPQSGERIRGRHNIRESRFLQPNKKRFMVRRMIGSGDLWVTEFILTYDGVPSYAVSIMEFREGLVANETQYFADRFDPAPSRAHLVERIDDITSF